MTILLWLASPLGRLLAGAAALLVFVSAFALDQRNRGAEKAIAKIERQDNAAASSIQKADTRSRNAARGMRGLVRDPNSVAE